ncbi:MAG: homoserine dehydrogenase [Thermaerobacter sp.]
MTRIRVGLLGLGVVGGAAARLIDAQRHRWRRQYGLDISWRRALVRDPAKPRPVDAAGRLTVDPAEIVEAGDIDVVVEAMGGVEPAGTYVLRALRAGKRVVTANKALLAERWEQLQEAAAEAGQRLGIEGAVAAAVPCLAAFEQVLAAAQVERIDAVLNGTCNFILHRMERTRASLAEVLKEAQALGYAEMDPTDDISGRDAARKGTVLSLLAWGRRPADVQCRGIEDVTPADVAAARDAGGHLRLVVSLEAPAGGEPRLRVGPQVLPAGHPLAGLEGPDNGLCIQARPLGRLFLSGPGAGGDATACAVVGDVIRGTLARPAGSKLAVICDEREATAAAPGPGHRAADDPLAAADRL